ncbi:MAG: PTS system mannose/fructose/sorbose family transporter subunit IID, partial [Chloroflexi bacterium]
MGRPDPGSGQGATEGTRKVALSRSDVQRSFWLWTFFSHSNYNYERLQGTAFAQAMAPIIRKLYKDPEDIKAALKRHLVFFNTEPNVGGVIHGAVIAMEEQRANGAPIDDDDINGVKSGLMGPLAGIGDSISQGTI